MSISTHCDKECNQAFTVEDFNYLQLPDGIEKTYITCPHCGHEYVAYYTDDEIRKLQQRIRRVQKRFADPLDNHEDAARKEAEIRGEIKEKMDALRVKVEGEHAGV